MLLNNDDWSRDKQMHVLADGRRLAFIDTGGKRPVLVLLHGFTDSSRSFVPMMPFLDQFRLVALDLPGHGASDALGPQTIAPMIDDVVDLIKSMGLGRFGLVGHSMGSSVATGVAARLGPAVTALILLAGARRPRLDNNAIIDPIRAFIDPINPEDPFFNDWLHTTLPVDMDFLKLVRKEAAAVGASVWNELLGDFPNIDLAVWADAVTAPVLSIGGSEDRLFSAMDRAELELVFGRCDTKILAGLGHSPHWESPETVARLISGFAGK